MRKGVLLALWIAACAGLWAAAPKGEEAGPVGKGTGSFFALSVPDAAAASRWYQEKLGFRLLSQGEAPNGISKFALLQGDGVIVEIIQHRDARPRAGEAVQVHGVFKAGMIVDDLDAAYKRVKERGVTIAYDLMPAKDVPLRSFSIRDGDGNLIQFFGK